MIRAVYTSAVLTATYCLCLLLSAIPCHADVADALFRPLFGWTHSPLFKRADSDEGHGIVLPGRGVTYGSPAIAEMDRDTTNGKEVAVVGGDGLLHVLSSSGAVLWSKQLPNGTCGSKANRTGSSPAVGELFGDGVAYVVIGYGGIGQSGCDGGVAAYRAADGALLWNFSLKKWHKSQRLGERFNTVWGTPALSDTDGDGEMEIGFGAFDRHVYLLNADGSVRWFYQAADTVWSSVAFADLDGDDVEEMVFATDISQNKRINPPTSNGGYVYAFSTTARKSKLIPFRTDYEWITAIDQVPWSSPVVADVLPDSSGPEVILQSGYYFAPQKKGHWIKFFSGKNGRLLQTVAVPSASASSVAVADVNGDGLLDVVAAISGSRRFGGDGAGIVRAWTPALGTAAMWSVQPVERGRTDDFYFQSPVVADLDGNGSAEVLISSGSSVVVLNGADGRQLTCADSECSSEASSLYAFGGLSSNPAVGDLDGDGMPEVVAAGTHKGVRGKGAVYVWSDFSALGSDAGSAQPFVAPWPQARGGSDRKGSR